MSRLEFRLPDIGEGLAEAELVRWLVSLGDRIAENEPIAEIETDKAIVTMPSPATGTVAEFLVRPGEHVKVGAAMVALDVAGGQPEVVATVSHVLPQPPQSTSAPSAPPVKASVQAIPAARKLATESGIEISRVPGTGPQGLITVEDVRAFVARAQRSVAATADAAVERVPVRGLRRRIAEAMTQSARTIPQVCGFHEIDATELSAAYERMKPTVAAQNVRLTYLAFLVKATAEALRECPYLNASFDEGEPAIVLRKTRNIGIATATSEGLLVPVIHDVDRLDLLGIAREAERLAAAARARTLQPADLQNGTFTISNVGASGGWFGTSIIRYPEVAILGAGKIEPRAVVRDGHVTIRRILPLSLTFDHRVIDGDAALSFVQTLRTLLERRESTLFAQP